MAVAKILVVAPHPDDDVIGCGGSIIRHVRRGNTVGVVYITSGDMGGLDRREAEMGAIREAEATKAAKLMGIKDRHFFRKTDGNLTCTREDIAEATKLIRDYRPDVVYLPHAYDGHRDHRLTHELITEACLWAARPQLAECGRQLWLVGTLLCYEVGTPLPVVNYTEDISDVIDLKIAAMQLHESQAVNLEYAEAVRNLNRLRGIASGLGAYCECFQVLRVATLFA